MYILPVVTSAEESLSLIIVHTSAHFSSVFNSVARYPRKLLSVIESRIQEANAALQAVWLLQYFRLSINTAIALFLKHAQLFK